MQRMSEGGTPHRSSIPDEHCSHACNNTLHVMFIEVAFVRSHRRADALPGGFCVAKSMK